MGAAVHHSQRAHVHSLVAHPHAAEAQDAARGVEVDHGRPLLLIDVQLLLTEAAATGAVAEDHVLQFALTALVTHRAVQRMVGEQELQGGFARQLHLLGVGAHHHALPYRHGTGGVQLGRLLDFHHAHAAGGLQ